MIKKRRYSIMAVLAAAVMLVASGCQSRPSSVSSEPESSSAVSLGSQPESLRPPYLFVNPLDPAGKVVEGKPKVDIPTMVEKVKENQGINPDVGAHLYIPDTTIDEPVLVASRYGTSMSSSKGFRAIYDQTGNRLNWKKEGTGLGGPGVAYFHTMANIDSRSQLSPNLVVFGHNNGMPAGQLTYVSSIPLADHPDGAMFAQLYKFLDEDFAKNHPYMFLSTDDDDYIYQIYAVSYIEANDPLEYFQSKKTAAEAMETAKDLIARSEWIYDDVDLKQGDKFLTLSTCTYHFTADRIAAESSRFVVSGRLLPASAKLKPTAKITKNPSPKLPQV